MPQKSRSVPIKAQFVTSVVRPDGGPDSGHPEVAFLGRSNVGKSSLINALAARHHLARTSRDPGRTRTLNYYLFEESYYLVDAPGYGYAKVSQRERQAYARLLEGYVLERSTLCGLFMVVDLRHEPMELDLHWAGVAHASRRPFMLIGQKADAVGQSQRHARTLRFGEAFGVPCLAFSAKMGLGRSELLAKIHEWCGVSLA